MTKPWESDDCEQLRSHYAYYSVPQAAMLWCGVPPEQVASELNNAKEHSSARGVWTHPYIPCLEPRCRVIQEAIDSGVLRCSRENGKAVPANDHVAPGRRHVSRSDLKAWIAKDLPGDKPAFLFDQIERSTHTSINADSFVALQADLSAKGARLEKAVEAYRKIKEERDFLRSELDSLIARIDQTATPTARAESTNLNIIGALLRLLLGKTPAGKPHSVFESQSAIIDALISHNPNTPGISRTTLENKFAEAQRRLSSK